MRLVLLLLSSVVFQGCLAFKWEIVRTDGKSLGEVVVESAFEVTQKPAYLDVAQIPGRANHFTLTSKAGSMVYVDFNSSVMIMKGKSKGLVSGNTKMANVDRGSLRSPIAPDTSAEIGLYVADNVEQSVVPGDKVQYRVAIQKEGEQRLDYLVMNVQFPSRNKNVITQASPEQRNLCYITSWLYGGFCWLVSAGPRDSAKAESIAKEKFGDDVTIRYVGRVGWEDHYQNNPIVD